MNDNFLVLRKMSDDVVCIIFGINCNEDDDELAVKEELESYIKSVAWQECERYRSLSKLSHNMPLPSYINNDKR